MTEMDETPASAGLANETDPADSSNNNNDKPQPTQRFNLAKNIARAATQTKETLSKRTFAAATKGSVTLRQMANDTANKGQSAMHALAHRDKKGDVDSSAKLYEKTRLSVDLAPPLGSCSDPSEREDPRNFLKHKDNHEKNVAQLKPNKALTEEPASADSVILDDRTILWITVISIALVQSFENWEGICNNNVPLSMMFAWMLVSFTAGLELNGAVLLEEIKTRLFGVEKPKSQFSLRRLSHDVVWDPPSFDKHELEQDGEDQQEDGRQQLTLFRMLRRRHQQQGEKAKATTPLTSLRRTRGLRETGTKISFDQNLMARLSRFRRNIRSSSASKEKAPKDVPTAPKEGGDTAPTSSVTASDASIRYPSLSPPRTPHTLGSYREFSRAESLGAKIELEPTALLRGMDLFLSDEVEQDMSNHPYLLKNGLRCVPTLMINVMTQWGTILVYFELPSWVKDTNKSLEEDESDSDDVKALKRFLSGDDNYRKARLKVMPELIDAPYPVRLLAPTGKEICVYQPGLVENYYIKRDRTGEQCPIFEVTLDLMGNSAIRGMASIFKRYLKVMMIDFALVISKPDTATEEEPETVLGLWRFDHIDVRDCPCLPDRFATDGCSDDTIHAIRASMLIKEASTRLLTVPV